MPDPPSGDPYEYLIRQRQVPNPDATQGRPHDGSIDVGYVDKSRRCEHQTVGLSGTEEFMKESAHA
ncbi:UNVERIFIED_ORG: hypothetical protein ABIB13_001178 [Arthrobacter sp. UYEF2]